MPQFAWTGRNAQQQPQSGVLEAASPAQVAEILSGMAVVPLSIVPHQAAPDAGQTLSHWLRRERVDDLALMLFARQMHTLLRSGVPIVRALASLATSTDHVGLGTVLRKLRAGLDSGHELSQAMAHQGGVFDGFFVAMVRVGEQTGRLAEVFLALFKHLEFQRFMRDQVKSALRYPIFVVGAMVMAMVVINLFVLPQFAKIFANLKTELPLLTRVLLGGSRATVDHWPWLLLAACGLWGATKAWLEQPQGRLAWDRAKLRLPIAGKILHKGAVARACGALAMVQRSGVPLVQGLSLAAEVVGNVHMAERLRGMRRAIERGDSVLGAATKAEIFTPLALQMVMVGEESGTLDEMLGEVAEIYQRDVELELKTIGQQIEPILIVGLGFMVLVLALGVFMPMWELGNAAVK